MKRSKVAVCLLAASWAGFLILFCAFIIVPVHVPELTLGQLATHKPPAGRIRVLNCVGGTASGRYFVFPALAAGRRSVVFSFPVSPPPEQTVFTGYCVGIIEEPIVGVDCDPPFVLVIDSALTGE